jgi:hypothetical protein
MAGKINKFFLPRPEDLPQLRTADGHPIPFAQLLAIDVDNISAEYETHAAWLATIGYASAEAAAYVTKLERKLARLGAQLLFSKTAEAHAAGLKRTVDAIKAMILIDEEYVALEDELTEAERKAGILKSGLTAFAARRDMLVNLGAEERLNRPRMLARED